MKSLLKLIGAALVLALLLLAWSFTPQRLDFEPPSGALLPPARPPSGMSLSALQTGAMHSQGLFAYRGGSLLEARDFSMVGILVRHPRGDLLFDTGFGRQVEAHARTLPALMKLTTRYSKGTPIADQFAANGYDPKQLAGIVITHAHWDHVSGIPDLPDTPVLASISEQRFIDSNAHMSALARRLDLPLKTYGFDDGPYLGFERSKDVYGDGAIVLVPAPGHTPGSIIAFIALPSGARYALLGDLVWQIEGVEIPAQRPWIARMLVDENAGELRDVLRHVAAIHQRFPEIAMVPAHDARVAASLPQFPQTAK